MSAQIINLSYHKQQLQAVQTGGELWLRVSQLVTPLGFSKASAIYNIFERNQDEFTGEETRLMTLSTDGGMQEVRVFSLRGVRLLTLLARTPEAKSFRRWVLDLLEGRIRHQPLPAQLALPGTYRLPLEAVEALDEVAGALEAGHPALAILRHLQDGSRTTSPNATIDHLVTRLEGARLAMAEANRLFRDVGHEAMRCGYTLESVKTAARRVREGGERAAG